MMGLMVILNIYPQRLLSQSSPSQTQHHHPGSKARSLQVSLDSSPHPLPCPTQLLVLYTPHPPAARGTFLSLSTSPFNCLLADWSAPRLASWSSVSIELPNWSFRKHYFNHVMPLLQTLPLPLEESPNSLMFLGAQFLEQVMFFPPWGFCALIHSNCAERSFSALPQAAFRSASWDLGLNDFPSDRPNLISPNRPTLLFSSTHPCLFLSLHLHNVQLSKLIILCTYHLSPSTKQGYDLCFSCSLLFPQHLAQCLAPVVIQEIHCQINELPFKITYGVVVDKTLSAIFIISRRREVKGSSHGGLSTVGIDGGGGYRVDPANNITQWQLHSTPSWVGAGGRVSGCLIHCSQWLQILNRQLC